MSILFFDQQQITDMDMIWGFLELGYEVEKAETLVPDAEYAEEDVGHILRELGNAKLIVTKDFSAAVAEACHRAGRVYLSWVHDAPQRGLYLREAQYETNIVFLFDRAQVNRLAPLHIPHLFHAPLAANVTRVSALRISEDDIRRYASAIAFVGNLYRNPEREAYLSGLSEGTRADVEAILKNKSGRWDKHHTVFQPLPASAFSEMDNNLLKDGLEQYAFPREYLLQTLILCREAAMRDRIDALNLLAGTFDVDLYTSDPADAMTVLQGVRVHGSVDYLEEAPKVFHAAKINLNLTTPSIETGVPLRVFDVMSVGGFVLSNDQEEAHELFRPDSEIVLFSALEELKEKADYYLRHETQRTKIAIAGYRRVAEQYTVPKALAAMLEQTQSVFGKLF